MGKIVHIRLLNGDEIIAEVSRKTKDNIIVKDALVVDEIKSESGASSSIFLSKYTLSAELTLSLKTNHVITMTNVSAEIEDYYRNSVDYSKTYIEPNKMAEIAKVSAMLAGINKPTEDLIVLKSPGKESYLSYSSNTIN